MLDKFKHEQLENIVKIVCETEPKIFSSLNNEQKKTLVRLFDLVMQSGEVENLYENGKVHGEKSLVYKVKNFKIYIKTWSEILNDFEIKHKFIQDKLQIQRSAIIEKNNSIEELMDKSRNSAVEDKIVNL